MISQNNPLDRKIDCWGSRIPSDVLGAVVWVNDTVELCWASARQVFGKDAKPELALQIYDRLVSRIKDDPALSKDLQDDVPS